MMKGDINNDGKITIEDMILIQAFMLGKIELTQEQQEAADLNDDGQISLLDIVRVQRHLNGMGMIIGGF